MKRTGFCIVLTALMVLTALVGCGRTTLPSFVDANGQDGNDPGDSDPSTDDNPGTPAIFGQLTAFENSNLEHGLELPSGLAICNGRLFVADYYQARVLIWNAIPARGQPDVVLGQPDLTTRVADYNGLNASSMDAPDGVACDSGTLVVADSRNHRVLIWSPLPTKSYEAASVVLGQVDFGRNVIAAPTASTLYTPSGVALTNNHLFVADSNNHRVLAWNTIPTTSGAPADFVLGQADFTRNTSNRGGNPTESTLSFPVAVGSDAEQLVIVDLNNHRALVWKPVPTAAVPALFVIGQAGFTTRGAGSKDDELNQPRGVGFFGDSLVVADGANDRVQVYAAITQNGQAAMRTFGVSARSSTSSPSYNATTLLEPHGVVVGGGEAYVSDSQAHRVLVYPQSVIAGTTPSATAVLGQPSLTSGAKRCPENGVTGAALALPVDFAAYHGRAIVVDFLYHRVLFWNAIPTTPGVPADFVIGQTSTSFYDPNVNVTDDSHFLFPVAAAVLADDLYIVDRDHNRVMIWDGVPTAPRPADRVLGQLSFDEGSARSTVDGTTLFQPYDITTDGARLVISDSGHNRVLLWNTAPADATVPADIVFGQSDKGGVSANRNGLSASSLNTPRSAAFTSTGLAIVDTVNNRVLIYNRVPTTDGADADVVLGQPDMTHGDAYQPNASTVTYPEAVEYSDGLLLVAGSQRVLIWRGVPTVNNAPADYVIGQPSFTSYLANAGGLTGDTLQGPGHMTIDSGTLYIADIENDRILPKPVPAH